VVLRYVSFHVVDNCLGCQTFKPGVSADIFYANFKMTTPVLIQLKNADIYSPDHVGIKDVLLSAQVVDIRDKIELTGKILKTSAKISSDCAQNYAHLYLC
jgi:hypothetical protein